MHIQSVISPLINQWPYHCCQQRGETSILDKLEGVTHQDTDTQARNIWKLQFTPKEKTWQHSSNRSFPNNLVNVVATYNILDRVGAHLLGCFHSLWLWYMVGVTIYVNVHACTMSMATPMQTGLTVPWKFSSWNLHFLLICKSFLPRKFPTIINYGIFLCY